MQRLTTLTISAMLAASGSACAPLSQAALVYSSSVKVGVGAAAGASSTSGFDVNIGYSQIDTAWVPVVVGRPCSRTGECEPLRTVSGSNNVRSSDETNRSLIERENAAVDRASGAVAALQEQMNDIRARVQRRNAEITSINATPVPEDAEPNASEERAQRITTLSNENETDETTIGTLNGQLPALQRAVNSAVAARDALIQQINQNDSDEKDDALSVFSSFDAGAGAGATTGPETGKVTGNATLTLGRVFSTGIASQNLTQGLRQSAESSSVASCLAAAERASTNADQTIDRDLRRTLSLACAPRRRD